MAADKLIDAKGSFCPGPLMELIAGIKMIGVGQTIELVSSDEGSAKDVPEWVNKVGHAVVANEKDGEGAFHVTVRKMK
ncbi:MAG: sulfurtransferase TusA family protein [Hyphomicrobiales bacterium]|nr:sulfurtransferase TusA family protein [Hyphomicrobiales bacterium]MDE2017901.1 sulfurtransferase TusA family protein [Hyphomicrobiales bacterium]